jgi:hypothetical protein
MATTKSTTKKKEPEVIDAQIIGKEPKREVALRDDRTPAASETLPVKYQAEALIAQAIEKGLAPETMDKFLAMRRELKAERAKEAYDHAMANFQRDCPVVKKSKDGSKTDSGKVAFKYATMGIIVSTRNEAGKTIQQLISENGLSYSFREEADGVKETMLCVISHVDGHSKETPFAMYTENGNRLTTKQQMAGGARTFAKRYAFVHGFGIITDDLDLDDLPQAPARVVVARPAMPQQVQTIVVKPPVPPQRTAEPTYHPEASEIPAAAPAAAQAATPQPAARHPLMPGQIGQMKTWIKQLAQIRRWTFPDETAWLKTQLTERYRCDQLTQLDNMQAAEFIGKLKAAVEKEYKKPADAAAAPAVPAEAAPESATYCPTCKLTFGERGAAADFKSIQTVGWCVACFKASNRDL